MKKIFLLLSVVALSTLTSCKKDRTCTCTITSSAPATTGVTSTQTVDYTMTKVSKGTAKRACLKETSTPTGYTGTVYSTTSDCKLK